MNRETEEDLEGSEGCTRKEWMNGELKGRNGCRGVGKGKDKKKTGGGNGRNGEEN